MAGANTQSNNPKQRLTLTNLIEPQQLRELNRQLEWIWSQLLGGLTEKALTVPFAQKIDSKADGETVTALEVTVDEVSGELATKASQESVDELSGNVSTLQSTVTQTATELSSRVSSVESGVGNLSGDVDSLGTKVATAESTISQHATEIELRAYKTDVTALSGRVNTAVADIALNADNIKLKVSKKTVTGDGAKAADINTFMTGDSAQSSSVLINSEGIRLLASTFLDLVSGGTVRIRCGDSNRSYINLDADLNQSELEENPGTLGAKSGFFSENLRYNNLPVVTADMPDLTLRFAAQQPTGHNILWLKPIATDFDTIRYSHFYPPNTGKDSLNDPGAVSRTYKLAAEVPGASLPTLPEGQYYTYTINIILTRNNGDDDTDKWKTLKIALTDSSGWGFSNRTQSFKIPGGGKRVEVVHSITSSTNIAAGKSELRLTVGLESGVYSLYVANDQTISVSIQAPSGSTGSGPKQCEVHYIP